MPLREPGASWIPTQGGWFAYLAIVAHRRGLAVNLRSGARPLDVGASVIVGRPIAAPDPVRITLVRRSLGVPQTRAVLCPVIREPGHPRMGGAPGEVSGSR